MRKTLSVLAVAGLVAAAASQCSTAAPRQSQFSTVAPRQGELPAPSDFVSRIDNPWFPLLPGTVYVYRGNDAGQPFRDVLTVTHATKLIQGIRATVVEDRAHKAGQLDERTSDWYAPGQGGQRLVPR
jgi:hypothetical protein